MLKKTLLIGALFALSSSALADGSFYAGVGLGYGVGEYDLSSTRVETYSGFLPQTIVTNANTVESAHGFLGDIFTGYGMNFNWIYAGAEVNFTAGSVESKSSISSSNSLLPGFVASINSNTFINNQFGVSLLPGINISNNVRLFGRVGYQHGTLNSNTSLNDLNGVTTASFDDGLNGIRYGLGLEARFCPRASVRVEYDRTSYQDYTINSGNVSLTIKPSVNEALVSVIFHFV